MFQACWDAASQFSTISWHVCCIKEQRMYSVVCALTSFSFLYPKVTFFCAIAHLPSPLKYPSFVKSGCSFLSETVSDLLNFALPRFKDLRPVMKLLF